MHLVVQFRLRISILSSHSYQFGRGRIYQPMNGRVSLDVFNSTETTVHRELIQYEKVALTYDS